jgi:hypothetical protein
MEEFEDDSESFKNLTSDLDYVFSQYLRNRYADKTGIVECYTCGSKHKVAEIQCGHFMSRGNLATRWMEENCRPQCMECNYFKTGNIEEFEHKLHEENGALVEYLRETARQPVRPTRDELKSLILEYRAKLNLVKKKFIEK